MSNPGPLEILLNHLLDIAQIEEHAPAPLDWDGGHEGSQDSLLQPDEGGHVGMDISSFSDLLNFCRESQASQVAQASVAGQSQAPTQASNPDPLELFLGQLLTEVQVEK